MAEPIERSAVRSDAEAASDPSPAAVASTAARALSLGSALATPDALLGIGRELAAIGLPRPPGRWGGWEQRKQLLASSDDILASFHLLDEIRDREEARWVVSDAEAGVPEWSARVDLWRSLTDSRRQDEAVAWLRMLMADREPTAAAAAAVALARWQKPREETGIAVPAALDCAKEVLPEYAESRNPDALMIAQAALGTGDDTTYARLPVSGPSPTSPTTSLLVPGTGAWVKSWYMVNGDFHTYIQKEVRQDLFSGYHAFQWSGKYRKKDRDVAAERLAGWVRDVVGHGLNTLFAHSYGGIIALNATTHGLVVDDLVLLSVPAESVPVEWRNIRRTVSLRIHMDLVLLAARRRQYFTENVEENYLPGWFFRHSDSHNPEIWQSEKCPEMLGLDPIV
jgi:Alpha/beta hydrolase family